MEIVLVLLGSYLIGAIPFSYLIARLWKGVDIRKLGSGNVGSTNVWRNVGPAAGLLAYGCDCGKGVLAVLLAGLLGDPKLMVLAACGVLVGHSWSVFLGFKGGKMVATGSGVILAMAPIVALGTAPIWLLALFLSKYVSVASIVAAVVVPVGMYIFSPEPLFLAFSIVLALATIVKHIPNIKRLSQGTEPKVSWLRKRYKKSGDNG